MLLTGCRKEFVRPECSHQSDSIACIAHLDTDISEALPYLNTTLDGYRYTREPPCLLLKIEGKLVAIHAQKICLAPLRDEAEGERIIERLRKEINDTWDGRHELEPRYETARRPVLMEILRMLPRTNCGKCGMPTCMVFAARAATGETKAEDCPQLEQDKRTALKSYLREFFS